MTAQQFLRVVIARWWVVLAIFIAMVGTTALVTRLLPKQYTAATRVVIEPKLTDMLGGINPTAGALAQTLMATQVDVINSERVARRVVRNMGFANSPAAEKQWREATNGGTGTVEDFFANSLLKHLDVKPARESAVVSIAFTGTDPTFSAEVANGFANAYIETSIELRKQPAEQSAKWFDEQLIPLRDKVEQAQAKLSAFQQKNGITASDERTDIESARLYELSQQVGIAQSQSLEAKARATQSKPSSNSVSDVSNSPVVQNLRAEVVRAEARFEEAAQGYGPNHPTLLRAKTEFETLKQRLEVELRNSIGTVGAQSRVAQQREGDMRQALAQQKERVLASKQQRDEAAMLMREVEGAQRVYDASLQRLAQNRLEAQTNQSNAFVLTPASVPGEASSPKTGLYISLSAVLGVLLGLAVAVLMEVLDQRVRCAADVESALRIPCLGSLPRERQALSLGWRASRSPALEAGVV
jgi:chain length determinant protein EpsF